MHHIIEATFKGLARCLRDAVRVEGGGVPSTKGVAVSDAAEPAGRSVAVLDYGIGNLRSAAEGARSTSAPTPGSPPTAG